jgi:hypothetical protein
MGRVVDIAPHAAYESTYHQVKYKPQHGAALCPVERHGARNQ